MVDDATVLIALVRGYKVLEEVSEENGPEQMAGLFTPRSQVVRSVKFPLAKEIEDFVVKSAQSQDRISRKLPNIFLNQFKLAEEDWALISPRRNPDSVLRESAQVESKPGKSVFFLVLLEFKE